MDFNSVPNGPLKRVAAIHDISGFGKCSMTVALPILSAAGLETCCVPTAVLSTHTGEFEGFTYRDLTEDLEAYIAHWKSLGLTFESIYSGFLGSPKQVAIVSDFIDYFRKEDTLVYIDPVMGDSGVLYQVFDDEMIQQMRILCQKADMLLPNITEAAFLTGIPYKEGPYNKAYIEALMHGLADFGIGKVVLTGVYFDDKALGAACFDAQTGHIHYTFSEHVEGHFYGTGDVFASFCLAAYLRGFSLKEAMRLAVDLTRDCTLRTIARGTRLRDGVDFEGVLPELMKRLELV